MDESDIFISFRVFSPPFGCEDNSLQLDVCTEKDNATIQIQIFYIMQCMKLENLGLGLSPGIIDIIQYCLFSAFSGFRE